LFVERFNAEHRHSGIKYVTPNQRHHCEADAICSVPQASRQARQQHPRRLARPPREWSQQQIVRVIHPRPQEAVAA